MESLWRGFLDPKLRFASSERLNKTGVGEKSTTSSITIFARIVNTQLSQVA